MDLVKLIMEYWLFPIAGIGIYELRAMRISVEQLNASVGIVISRVDGHEKRLDNLESKA